MLTTVTTLLVLLLRVGKVNTPVDHVNRELCPMLNREDWNLRGVGNTSRNIAYLSTAVRRSNYLGYYYIIYIFFKWNVPTKFSCYQFWPHTHISMHPRNKWSKATHPRKLWIFEFMQGISSLLTKSPREIDWSKQMTWKIWIFHTDKILYLN